MTAVRHPGVVTRSPSTPEHDRLTLALVRLADRGQRPRCGEQGDHALWTSDRRADRQQAAPWCVGCPVRTPCAHADSTEAVGVWGGVDRTRSPHSEAEEKPP